MYISLNLEKKVPEGYVLDHSVSTLPFLYRMLEQELELRDRMFQEYREGKEREVAELTRIKQDLEIRLQAALDSQDGSTLDFLDPSAKGLLCGMYAHDCILCDLKNSCVFLRLACDCHLWGKGW